MRVGNDTPQGSPRKSEKRPRDDDDAEVGSENQVRVRRERPDDPGSWVNQSLPLLTDRCAYPFLPQVYRCDCCNEILSEPKYMCQDCEDMNV